MNPEDIGRILDEIGERIGPAGEYAWQLTVKQVYLEGVLGTIIGGLLTLAVISVLVTALVLITKKHNADKAQHTDGPYSSFDPFGYMMSAGMSALVAALALSATGSWFYLSALLLLNPEYHAMQRLLTTVLP